MKNNIKHYISHFKVNTCQILPANLLLDLQMIARLIPLENQQLNIPIVRTIKGIINMYIISNIIVLVF